MKYYYLFRYTLSNKQIKRTCNISDCPQKKNCDFCAKTRLQCFICFLFGIKSKMTKFPFCAIWPSPLTVQFSYAAAAGSLIGL